MWIEVLQFAFTKVHLKISSANYRPFRSGLSVLITPHYKADDSQPQPGHPMTGDINVYIAFILLYLIVKSLTCTVSDVLVYACTILTQIWFGQWNVGRIIDNMPITIISFVYTALQWRHSGTMASQITSLTFVYSTVYSGADQRKHQSSAWLAFVRGIHRWIPRTKGQ